MVSEKQAIQTYEQLAEKLIKREEREEGARKLALSQKMSMGVIKCGKGDYQIWPLSMCGKNTDVLYTAEYFGEGDSNG